MFFVVCKADEKVTAEELHHLAEVIQGWWEKFALTLDPNQFKVLGNLAAIKCRLEDPELQAQAMLETWCGDLGDSAHRRLLIKALIKRRQRKEAIEVFEDDLVQQVCPQDSRSSKDKDV